MGKKIDKHIKELQAEKELKSKLETELSKANQPKYLKFLWETQKPQFFLTFVGLAGCIGVAPVLFNPDNDIPILAAIGAGVAIVGFTVCMVLQPYFIYKNLIKLNYWSPNSAWSKQK